MAVPKGSTKPRRPSSMKDRDGTLHPERENEKAPPLKPGVPPAPPYLNAAEKMAWAEFAEVLHGRYNILSKDHFAAFESLVIVWAQTKRLDQEIRDNEVTHEVERFDKQGNRTVTLTVHPAWAARRQVGQELRQLLGVFGLTPADMGRVSMLGENDGPKGPGKQDPDAEFSR